MNCSKIQHAGVPTASAPSRLAEAYRAALAEPEPEPETKTAPAHSCHGIALAQGETCPICDRTAPRSGAPPAPGWSTPSPPPAGEPAVRLDVPYTVPGTVKITNVVAVCELGRRFALRAVELACSNALHCVKVSYNPAKFPAVKVWVRMPVRPALCSVAESGKVSITGVASTAEAEVAITRLVAVLERKSGQSLGPRPSVELRALSGRGVLPGTVRLSVLAQADEAGLGLVSYYDRDIDAAKLKLKPTGAGKGSAFVFSSGKVSLLGIDSPESMLRMLSAIAAHVVAGGGRSAFSPAS